MASMLAYKLCQDNSTVSSEVAKDPKEAPINVIKRLYGDCKPDTSLECSGDDRPPATTEELERARQCGHWGPQQPSDFFLRVYNDALQCLGVDPMASMVSPPLMGSHGTIPLAVIAPLADIVRHMSNLIVRAEKEVILITCSWSPSVASRLISDALRELSIRAGQRGDRVVVKVMYDKAGAAQLINSRQPVSPDVYSGYSPPKRPGMMRTLLTIIVNLFNCPNQRRCPTWISKLLISINPYLGRCMPNSW